LPPPSAENHAAANRTGRHPEPAKPTRRKNAPKCAQWYLSGANTHILRIRINPAFLSLLRAIQFIRSNAIRFKYLQCFAFLGAGVSALGYGSLINGASGGVAGLKSPDPYPCIKPWRCKSMERLKGIEPSSSGWEPGALPLSYSRVALADTTRQRRPSSPFRQSRRSLVDFRLIASCMAVRCGACRNGGSTINAIRRDGAAHVARKVCPVINTAMQTARRIFSAPTLSRAP
jgi:hypothetical protein